MKVKSIVIIALIILVSLLALSNALNVYENGNITLEEHHHDGEEHSHEHAEGEEQSQEHAGGEEQSQEPAEGEEHTHEENSTH